MLQALGLAVIPAWLTSEEVERGDDMGLERPSAHAWGLVVEYWAMNGDREDRIEEANVEPWMSVMSITPLGNAGAQRIKRESADQLDGLTKALMPSLTTYLAEERELEANILR